MSSIGLYTDRQIFGTGLTHALLPAHRVEVLRLEDIGSSGRPGEVAILDAPPEHSPQIIRQLRAAEPHLPLVVWERVTGSEPALSALGSGVRGIMLDCTTAAEARTCIDTVLGGGIWVPLSIAQAVVSSRSCHLTRREGQLVNLVTQGLSNKEIARTLGISIGTVKVYFSRLFDKLGVSDRYELAVLGLRQAGTVCLTVPAVMSATGAQTFPQTVFLPRTYERGGERTGG